MVRPYIFSPTQVLNQSHHTVEHKNSGSIRFPNQKENVPYIAPHEPCGLFCEEEMALEQMSSR